MSHFSVLVIGDDPEEQLAKFKAEPEEGSPLLMFEDTTEQFKKEYETETYLEFDCASPSLWGIQITQELFEQLAAEEPGFETTYLTGKIIGLPDVFRLGARYRAYYKLEDGKRCEGSQWLQVLEFIKVNKGWKNDDELFDGELLIKKIAPPREFAIKDHYKTFDEYMQQYRRMKPTADGRYGVMNNPNTQWDWLSPGGRWNGMIRLKADTGSNTDASEVDDETYQARKCDILNLDEIIAFCVVMNGTWYQKNGAGWWGNATTEKPENEWELQIAKLLHNLADDTLISIYDCHF